ncbi:MAG: 1-deoxy-D-xylulose-5-phosphate synthase [Bacteroidia bacterium]
MKTRIMYIEDKSNGLTGIARIGKVTFSKTMKSIHYKGKTYQSLKGSGLKANFFETESGDGFWISGCKKDGSDRNYGERVPIYIDDDIQEEYWTVIRNLPDMVGTTILYGK